MANNLIIYYSRTGENYWNGSIKKLRKGNTEIVAEFIQKAVGGDLFHVETIKSIRQTIMPAVTKPNWNCTTTHALRWKHM